MLPVHRNHKFGLQRSGNIKRTGEIQVSDARFYGDDGQINFNAFQFVYFRNIDLVPTPAVPFPGVVEQRFVFASRAAEQHRSPRRLS